MGVERGVDRKRRRFVVELLEHRRLLAGQISQVNYFDTWDGGVIRSTDVAGIAYHPPSGQLYLADSEINELSLFNGDNIFATSLAGDQVFREIASGNSEPTGITYNEFDGYFYVSNDTGDKTVTRYDHNLDNPLLVISTSDDVSSAVDPEGITSDPSTGMLYVSDGNGGGKQILVYDSNLQYQYRFSVSNQGDAEGIAFHQPSGNLFVIDGRSDTIYEYTTTGSLLQSYDISDFSPAPQSPQGLTFGPTSDPSDSPSALSIYIADGMEDNEADGRVYEAVLGVSPPPENRAPTTSGISDVSVNTDAPDTVINLFAAFDDSEDPDPALTYTIENNTNPSLFDSTTIDGSQGTLTLDYASATEGTSDITVRATDTGSPPLSVETTFTVTVKAVVPGDTVTIEVRIASSSDDAEERTSSGSVSLSSSDLELIQDKSRMQVVGMRFTDMNIPPGATIQNAYIQFQTDETGSDPTSLTIAGQAVDDAPAFTSSGMNITSRATTSTTVNWSPAPWNTKDEAGANQRTTNIAPVIQQIVNRPGWSSGNALAIIMSGSGTRTAESFDGESDAAPLLHVEYIVGDPPDNYPPTTSGISDVNVTEDASDTVIDLFAAFDDVEDPDTALTYSIFSNTNSSLFSSTPISGSQGTLTLDYAPGATGSADITVRATDTGSPPLSVDTIFTVTVSPAPPPGGSIKIEARVSSSDDDAEERSSGSVNLTSSDLELIQDKSRVQTVGMRFTGLSIPPGALIQNAYIQFQADESGSKETSLTFRGDASDNAAAFTGNANNISNRSTTSASATWTPAAWNKGDAGPDQKSPNIAAVIQEIVDRPGWTSGNSLAIIVTGSGTRTAEAFDGESTAAPLLHVEFDNPLVVQADAVPESAAAKLDESQLADTVAAAMTLLPLSPDADSNFLAGLSFEVVDLSGNMLGHALPAGIQIDVDAAGYGWFVDPTPLEHSEFSLDLSSHQMVASVDSPAKGRVDLLTTVLHELGHLLGLEHSESGGVMDASLPLGTRRLFESLSDSATDAYFAQY